MKKWFKSRKAYQKQIEDLNAQLQESQIRLMESRQQLDHFFQQQWQPPYDVNVNAIGSHGYEEPNIIAWTGNHVGYGTHYNIHVTPLSWYDEPITPPKHVLDPKRKIRVEQK